MDSSQDASAMALPNRPRLRRVESFPVSQADGEMQFALRDPDGFSGSVVLPYHAAVLASLMDGSRTLAEIQSDFEQRLGHPVSLAAVEKVVRDLDGRDFFDTQRFRARWKREIENYLNLSVRPAAHAGRAYADDATALREQIAALFSAEKGPGVPRELAADAAASDADKESLAAPTRQLCGVLSPHIDFRRGGVSIAWAHKKLVEETDADLFVILGTAHNPMRNLFSATKKDFATPLGKVETDRRFVAQLAAKMSAASDGSRPNLMADELAHRQEHSIEFQAVLLQYLLGGRRPFKIVPILVGSFHEFVDSGVSPRTDPRVATFVKAIRAMAAEHSGRVCTIGSADLAHIGQRYGDPKLLDADRLTAQSRSDHELMTAACKPDAERFFRLIAASKDRDRICGLSPTYIMLEVTQPTSGELLRYDQAVELDGTSCVSFASAAFYRD